MEGSRIPPVSIGCCRSNFQSQSLAVFPYPAALKQAEMQVAFDLKSLQPSKCQYSLHVHSSFLYSLTSNDFVSKKHSSASLSQDCNIFYSYSNKRFTVTHKLQQSTSLSKTAELPRVESPEYLYVSKGLHFYSTSLGWAMLC